MLFFLQYRFNRKKEGFSIYLVSLGFLFFSSFETKRRAIRYGRIGRKGKGNGYSFDRPIFELDTSEILVSSLLKFSHCLNN